MELTGLLQMAPFRGMKEEELVAFLFGLPNSLKHFEPGDIIARQGDLCKGLYILASGSVRAGMINDEGKELTVEEIGAPNLLASAFIFATENRFPVNVEAIGPCEVFVIGKERFLEFMRLHPLMMQNFLKDISDRSVFLSRKLKTVFKLKRYIILLNIMTLGAYLAKVIRLRSVLATVTSGQCLMICRLYLLKLVNFQLCAFGSAKA